MDVEDKHRIIQYYLLSIFSPDIVHQSHEPWSIFRHQEYIYYFRVECRREILEALERSGLDFLDQGEVLFIYLLDVKIWFCFYSVSNPQGLMKYPLNGFSQIGALLVKHHTGFECDGETFYKDVTGVDGRVRKVRAFQGLNLEAQLTRFLQSPVFSFYYQKVEQLFVSFVDMPLFTHQAFEGVDTTHITTPLWEPFLEYISKIPRKEVLPIKAKAIMKPCFPELLNFNREVYFALGTHEFQKEYRDAYNSKLIQKRFELSPEQAEVFMRMFEQHNLISSYSEGAYDFQNLPQALTYFYYNCFQSHLELERLRLQFPNPKLW